jgi:hypothetical protein
MRKIIYAVGDQIVLNERNNIWDVNSMLSFSEKELLAALNSKTLVYFATLAEAKKNAFENCDVEKKFYSNEINVTSCPCVYKLEIVQDKTAYKLVKLAEAIVGNYRIALNMDAQTLIKKMYPPTWSQYLMSFFAPPTIESILIQQSQFQGDFNQLEEVKEYVIDFAAGMQPSLPHPY